MPPPPNLEQLLLQIQFPGMPLPESDVAMLWLRAHGHEYDAIEFNVRLGEGATPIDGLNESTVRQAKLITQKRADAIASRDGRAEIIEFKIRAGLGAVGQLKGYQALYTRDHADEPVPLLRIVAKFVDPDVQYVASSEGIEIVLFERR